MSTIINISESIKNSASNTYGEPPYGHAELSSLKRFTKLVDLDLNKSIERLQQAGIHVENDSQTINDIATQNNITPKHVYEIMSPASQSKTPSKRSAVPNLPPPGFGNKKLSQVCVDFGLNLSNIQTILAKQGINSTPEMAIKEIAADNNIQPMDVFELIKYTTNTP